MTDLLHMCWQAEIIRRPVDPDGPTISEPDWTRALVEQAQRRAAPHEWISYIEIARIDLAKHDDCLWMWGVVYHFNEAGGGYQVGPKWGKFALSQQAALEAAIAELLGRCEQYADDPRARRVAAWARRLRLDDGGRA